MMNYELFISRAARKELSGLPEHAYGRIKDAVFSLAADPRPTGCKKLTGREGWRIRVGDYRILYNIDEEFLSVNIIHIGFRHNIYK